MSSQKFMKEFGVGFENWDLQIPNKGEFVILVYRGADSDQSYPQE